MARGRAIIPANGFHEWTGPKGHKQCHNITATGTAIAFAGLYELWGFQDEVVPSFTIITLPAHPRFSHIHDKSIPLMLRREDFDLWLAMLKKPGTPFLVFGDPLLRYHLTPSGIMSHTGHRLHCCMAIAARYYPDLRTRPGPALSSLWYRVTALHLEAVRAYAGRGKFGCFLLMLGQVPFRLLTTTFSCLFKRPVPRGRHLRGGKAIENEQ